LPEARAPGVRVTASESLAGVAVAATIAVDSAGAEEAEDDAAAAVAPAAVAG
jgi:hypothetical protein